MNRRIFFRSFAGLGMPGIPAAKAKPATLWVHGPPMCGECRIYLLVHADRHGPDPREFVMCVTEGCSQRGKALFLPGVEAAPADPRLVRRVLRSENEQAKKNEIERARIEEKWRQDGERASWSDYKYTVHDTPRDTLKQRHAEAWRQFARDRNAWRDKYQRWEEPVFDEERG